MPHMSRVKLKTLLLILIGFVSVALLILTIHQLKGEFPFHTQSDNQSLETMDPLTECSTRLNDMLWEADHGTSSGQELDKETLIATYTVNGETITALSLPSLDGRMEALQQDTSLHEEIWSFITTLVPVEYRMEVTRFRLFTDGIGGALGAVKPMDNPQDWMIEIDIQDADDLPTLTTTLIHETAHLLTLNSLQMETYPPLFEKPQDDAAFQRGKAACPTYFLYEGCSYPDSYLNLFFQHYWEQVYNDWLPIQEEEKEGKRTNMLAELYNQYAAEFVSSYAVTSPEEDIAETFLYFVLSPQPAGESIADQKILFFYEYPALVDLRTHMRSVLCDSGVP
jgi:hypothetical protein